MFEIVMEGLKQNRRDSKGLEQYQRSLRSPVRGLWQGVINADQFQDAMLSIVDRGLTSAFTEGSAECGIAPEEWTEEEQETLAGRVLEEMDHVDNFAVAIAENSRANGGQLTPLFGRLELWANRYRDVTNQAKVMSCKNQKLIWELGPTEHCSTCARLAGKVKRASYWKQVGLYPQNPPNPLLQCGGWK